MPLAAIAADLFTPPEDANLLRPEMRLLGCVPHDYYLPIRPHGAVYTYRAVYTQQEREHISLPPPPHRCVCVTWAPAAPCSSSLVLAGSP
jgi:hypothetical protein